MLCGHMKTECTDLTLGELKAILDKCRNDNAIIKYSDTNHFFIHFDQDGEFINFSKIPADKNYGDRGADNKCCNCEAFNKNTHVCECNPEDCMNYLGYYNCNNCLSTPLAGPIERPSTKKAAESDKGNVAKALGVNDSKDMKKNNDPKEIIFNGKSVALCGECDINMGDNNTTKENKKDAESMLGFSQKYMDELLAASLEKMLKGLKEN